jgi:CRP-like cAMP-binding protein
MQVDASRAGFRHAATATLTPPCNATQGLFELMGAPFQFARNAEVYGEGDEAEYLYQVTSGVVRSYNILEDGRRQIGAFYFPGDILGFEAGDEHSCSAEAVCPTQVLIIKRTALLSRADRERNVARPLWEATARELGRVQQHLLLLVKSAEQRLASFLLEIARRRPGSSSVDLAMSRQDIADYLGLTIETVSRTFTQLEQDGVIALTTSRQIELRNRSALARLDG